MTDAIDRLIIKMSSLDKDDLDLVTMLSDSCNDSLEVVSLSKQHPLATVPGKNNWIEKTSDSGLPDRISRLAQDLIEKGMDRSRAIATAISRAKVFAATLKDPRKRALWAKDVAAWEALKAKNKARTAAGKVSRK